ncbi:MAG: bacillithiol biosynthesis cysteine-adding enzyme BshC [Flavobacteriaceae bacterium]|jgi:bacillithiol biosynthesis cysteine-adding enzyme BshC
MQVDNIHRKDTGLFTEHQVKLSYDQESLTTYLHHPFSKEAIGEQLKLKSDSFSDEQRNRLADALIHQNKEPIHAAVLTNIEALRSESTYTVTTGHQLTLLAGPLYFILKILQVIKLSEEVNQSSPDHHIVPVYWMASEDHDYEEIQSTNLFNKKLTNDYQQRGPVGKFELTGFEDFKAEILAFFGEDKQEEIKNLLDAYSGDNLADATRGLVNSLFSEYGLVIIDGDDKSLKASFAPIIKAELLERQSEKLVIATSEQMKEEGLNVQVFPRPINLFYSVKGNRTRIEFDNGIFSAGDKTWSESEILTAVDSSPENFSPNVVLRPVYQELILPNLAYIGGAGEISYWLQLKSTFEHYAIQYPLIQVRNSVVWIDRSLLKKLDKTDLTWVDVFKGKDELKKSYVQSHGEDTLDFSKLDALKNQLNDEIMERVTGVNPNLSQFANAEIARLEKQLEGLKAKLVKDSKGKHEQAMKDIDFIKDRLFPNGGLQERSANLLSFCADGQVKSRVHQLYDAIQPFGRDMLVLLENE